MGVLGPRRLQGEVMDQPDLPRPRHEAALRGLARINFLSAAARGYLGPLGDLQRRLGASPLRVLDVACGGGDVSRQLCRSAARRGLDLRVAGCDLSPVAVEYARREAARAGVDADYFVHDALSGPLPAGYHAVVCSLFLHHLTDDDAVRLLEAMRRAEGVQAVLVSDLDRSLYGLALAHVFCRLLSRSDVVHVDGPRSVRAAFTPTEALQLARRAGLAGCSVRRAFPARWLLTWEAP